MNWHKIFPKIYVRVRPNNLHVLLIGTGKSEEVVPNVAVRLDNGKAVAVGDEVAKAVTGLPGKLKVVNGFNHPRSVIGDFDAAGLALRYLIEKLLNRKAFIAPIVVINPPENVEGGLTQVERRALKDLCMSTGAREVLFTDHGLSEREMLDIKNLRKRLSINKN